MNHPIRFKTTPPLLITLTLLCFGLLPRGQAVVPPPDGGYPGFTTAEGTQALQSLTTGAGNTGVGFRALFADTTGSFNTGLGAGTLVLNRADSNTAVGAVALFLNTTGTNNTAVGTDALVFNDSGSENTAVGTFALENSNVDGNTATGAFALFANTTGGTLETVSGIYDLGPNTAVGAHALENNVDGSANTAVGYNALHSQVHGQVISMLPQLAANTAVGFEALANVTGSAAGANFLNTALGYEALGELTDGQVNVAVGALAGFSLTTGNFNVNVGYLAGSGNLTGSDNIFIGNIGPSLPDEFGHTYIDNIRFTSQPSGGSVDFVTVNTSTGLLGHNSSSRRYKEDIKPMNKSSEALYRLKPVTYRVKKEINSAQPTAFGLIAEEVADVNPDLIVRNAQDQVEGVHYEMVNAMLLNEFLKEHRKVQEQEATIALLKSTDAKQEAIITELASTDAKQEATIAKQQRQIERLTEGLQKVSAQLGASKPAPQVVNNP